MEVRRYRVHTAIRGVYATAATKGFVSIPTGAILAVVRDGDKFDTYITVQWNNRELLVFPQDLSERAVECEVPPETAA